MNTLFLMVWIVINPLCTLPEGCEIIQSQIVNSENELTEVYDKHKYEGVKVFKVQEFNCINLKGEKTLGVMDCQDTKIVELEFKESPCGKWVEVEKWVEKSNYADGIGVKK